MNSYKQQWLKGLAEKIPRLFGEIQKGNYRSELNLGERVIEGKRVRLYIAVEVIDTGPNPLGSHASSNYPTTHKADVPEMPEIKPRRRNRSKRR